MVLHHFNIKIMSNLKTRAKYFEKLTSQKYVPLYGLWENSYIGWAKCLSDADEIYSYVHAYRSKNGGQFVDFVISTPTELGQNYEKNSFSFNIKISEDWNDDGTFFEKCLPRVENMLKLESKFVDVVLDEINNPSKVSTGSSDTAFSNNIVEHDLKLLKALISSEYYDEIKDEIIFGWKKKKSNFKLILSDDAIKNILKKMGEEERIFWKNREKRLIEFSIEQKIYIHTVSRLCNNNISKEN